MREITGAKLAFLLSISEIIVAPELNQLIFLDLLGHLSQTLLLVDMKRYVQMLVFHGFQLPSRESFFPSIHFEPSCDEDAFRNCFGCDFKGLKSDLQSAANMEFRVFCRLSL
jgi:hypothetical protein